MPFTHDIDLRSVALFAGVAPSLFLGAPRRDYRTGETLIAEGGDPDRLLVLTRGAAEVRCEGTLLTDRQAVSVLGEQALLEGKCHSATVIARGAVVTAEYSGAMLDGLLADPVFTRNLAVELSTKLRQATADRAYRYASEERLFPAFRSHTSPEVLADLLADGVDGTPRSVEAAVLFSDVRDFTRLTAQMPPQQIADELAGYLDLAVEVVQRHGGIVDKYVGDAVMAVWAYPAGECHAARALAAARELAHRSQALRFGGEPLRIGVGIDAGVCFVGTVGSPGKRQFTALGAVVNRAARAESETKATGAVICVADGAHERLGDADRAALASVGMRDLKGFGPVPMWGVMNGEEAGR